MGFRVIAWQTAVVTSFLAGPLSAQSPSGYRLQRGDTLRFREITILMTDVRGTVRVTSVLAVAFAGADTARAWYEALTLTAGPWRPETQGALRQPFLLHFDSRGRIRTLQAPRFPDAFERVSDLTKQFHDFFLRLPEDLNLTVGRTWTDTVIQADSTESGPTDQYARVITYTVTGDTVVGGSPALAIATRQQIRLSASTRPERLMTVRSVLEGEDNGVYVFAPATGRLLGRSRTGQLAGTITYTSTYEPGAWTRTHRQHYKYTNTIAAVSGLMASLPTMVRAQEAPPAPDTSGLAGSGAFTERLAHFVETVQRRQEQEGSMMERGFVIQISGALDRADSYLSSHPEDTRALILAARLGLVRQHAQPFAVSPETRDSLVAVFARFHAYLNRAISNDPNNAQAQFWKARMFEEAYSVGVFPGVRDSVTVRAQADSAVRFARRAVELAPQESIYRESLAQYLLVTDHAEEAAATLRDVAGGRHPVYLLLSDRHMMPLPPGGVVWPEHQGSFVAMLADREIDHPNLRPRSTVLPMSASQIEAFYGARWPGLRLFEVSNEVEDGVRTRLFAQFMRMQGATLEPARRRQDVESLPDEPPDGFMIFLTEVSNPSAGLRSRLPITVGNVVSILDVWDTRRVGP